MAFVPLKIPPGFFRNGTKYASMARWYEGNLVRFVRETLRPVGGWSYLSAKVDGTGSSTVIALDGIPRGAYGWELAGGRGWQAYGTCSATAGNTKVYAYSLGSIYDISPAGTTSLFQDTFTQADTTDLNTIGYNMGGGGFSRVSGNKAYRVWGGTTPLGYAYTSATYITQGSGKTYDVYIDVTREQVDLTGQGGGLTFWATSDNSDYVVIYIIRASATTVDIKIERIDSGSTYDSSTLESGVTLAAGGSIRIGARLIQDSGTVTPFRADAGTGSNRNDYSAWTHTDSNWHSTVGYEHVGVYWRGAGSASYDRIALDNLSVDEIGSGLLASNEDTSLGAGSGATYYGQGLYGDGPYGQGNPVGSRDEADVWHMDNFGDYLVLTQVPTNDSLYYWDPSTPSTEMLLISDIGGATGVPANVSGLVVTPERFLVALGANGDVRKVAWADQESLSDWTPTALNTAGDFNLEGKGRIMAGRRGRAETLIWTDAEIFAMRYIGGSLVYGFEKKGSNCGLIAPLAVAEVDSFHVWMGLRNFYIYDGYVRTLPCEVRDYVFSDLNYDQVIKVMSFVNHEFSEVWWFYPSSGSDEIDRYVVWNYVEDHWVTGFMDRTCGIPASSLSTRPTLLNSSGSVFLHESGWDHTIAQASNYTPYAESGPVEIGAGDQNLHVMHVIPDEATLGDVLASVYVSFYPMGTETEVGPFTVADHQDCRAHGRWARLKVTENLSGDWRVGTFRLDIKPGGRR